MVKRAGWYGKDLMGMEFPRPVRLHFFPYIFPRLPGSEKGLGQSKHDKQEGVQSMGGFVGLPRETMVF